VQPDGRLLVGGWFTTIGGQPRTRIARLNADGSLDTRFNPTVNQRINTLALQPDGKLLIGGLFTAVNGVSRSYIARLNANGSLDMDFNPSADSFVFALAVQPDGSVLVGGEFTALNNDDRRRIARLNADGSLDAAFDPAANAPVLALAVLPDGKPVVGGELTVIGGQPRNHIARLSSPQAALPSLNLSGGTVTWMRSGAGPELALPPQLMVASSLDGVYVPIAPMQRISGGWQLTGATVATDTTFYLRTRAQVGMGNGSVGLIESTRQFFLVDDRIFSNGFE